MTLPTIMTGCPVCGKGYAALANHLRRNHCIRNATERSILLKLGTGRIPIRTEPCPVPGCEYHSSRLDKHLSNGHGELGDARRQYFIYELKRRTALTMLANLRATNPNPAMVSTLDLEPEGEEQAEEPFLGPAPEERVEEGCEHCQALKEQNGLLQSEILSLKKELEAVRHENRLLKRRSSRSQRRGSGKSPAADTEVSESAPAEVAESGAGEASEALRAEVTETATAPLPLPAEPEPGPSKSKGRVKEAKKPKPLSKRADPGPSSSSSSSAQPEVPGPPSSEPHYEALLEKKGRASMLRKITFPSSIEEYLNEYQKYQAGAAPVGRNAEAAQSKVSRVRSFLYFMAQSKQDLWQWLFLGDTDKVRR